MRRLVMSLLLCVAAAAPLAAQDDPNAVRPGMSENDVRQRWGEPVAVRRANDWTFLFYSNGMEREVGWYDVVFLQNNQVVNAIVRGAGHGYAGQSTAPPSRAPEPTLPARPQPDNPDAPSAATGARHP